MPRPGDTAPLPRRRFLQWAALAGVGVAFARPGIAAEPPPPAAPAPPPAPATPAAPSEDARAIAGVLRRRYPEALDDAQWDTVARDIDGDLGAGRRLRALKLTNADEPDGIFRP